MTFSLFGEHAKVFRDADRFFRSFHFECAGILERISPTSFVLEFRGDKSDSYFRADPDGGDETDFKD
jgi:hypothetical protein